MSEPAYYNLLCYIASGLSVSFGLISLNWLIVFINLHKVGVPVIRFRQLWPIIIFSLVSQLSFFVRIPYVALIDAATYSSLYPLSYALGQIGMVGISYVIVFRNYLVYYNVKLSIELEDNEWSSVINKDANNWYIRNQNKYGKSKNVSVCLVMLFLIVLILGILVVLIKGRSKFSHLLALVNYLIPVVMLLTLACKIPKFNDFYHLRSETFFLSILLPVCVVFLSIPLLIFASKKGSYSFVIGLFAQCLIPFTFNFICLFWVFYVENLPKFFCETLSYQKFYLLKTKAEEEASKKLDIKQFFEMFQADDLFRRFASHLSLEFCIENIFFFVETLQYVHNFDHSEEQKDDTKDVQKLEVSEALRQINGIKLANVIPKSEIIEENKKDHAAAAVDVYLKYVDYNTADFVINISFDLRREIEKVLGLQKVKSTGQVDVYDKESLREALISQARDQTISNSVLISMYDNARLEVQHLLFQSFTRLCNKENTTDE